MNRVIVTGSSGFIGCSLVPTLRAAGYDVIALTRAEGDIGELSTWQKLPTVDCVVHLAARSFVPDSWQNPSSYLHNNVLGTNAALEFCRTHGAQLVFLSSYLYGTPVQLPLKENAPIQAINPYGLSKKMSEDICRFYAEYFLVPVTVLRPFNVYGPGQQEPFLIPFLVRQLYEKNKIIVKDLEPRRDYIYIKDLVDGILKSISPHSGFRVFNLGSGMSYSVAQIIQTVQYLSEFICQ